jgi:hypothetical protein
MSVALSLSLVDVCFYLLTIGGNCPVSVSLLFSAISLSQVLMFSMTGETPISTEATPA